MRKALSAILTPLLALLLAVPLTGLGPSASSGSTVGVAESAGVPVARPTDSLLRSLAGLQTRSSHDGQGAAPAAAPAVSSACLSLDLRFLRFDPPSYAAPVTGSARALPALPTGPPSYS